MNELPNLQLINRLLETCLANFKAIFIITDETTERPRLLLFCLNVGLTVIIRTSTVGRI